MCPISKRFGSALLALALSAGVARGDVADLLQPGSRAALGLGGDPFLSPLADESGWWSQAGLASGRMRGMSAELSAPIAMRRGNVGALNSSRFGALVVEEWRAPGSTVRFSGMLRDPHWHAGVSTSSGDLAVRGGASTLVGGLRAERGSGGIVLQATGPLWSETNATRHEAWGVGARLRRKSLGAAQISWTREETPDVLRSDLYGEPIAASLNLAAERLSADAAIRAWGWLSVEGTFARSRFLPLGKRGREPEYDIEPVANGTDYEAALRTGPVGEWTLLARRTARDLDLSGDASWGGQRFGRLNKGRFEQQSWLVALDRRTARSRLLAEYESAAMQAAGRVTVESWPFTSTLVDLLGYRRFFQLQGSMSWGRLHIGAERELSPAWRVRAGANGFDLFPEARLISWQPTFLVFGVSDLREEVLDTRRLQLAAASVGATWRSGMLEAALDLRQFVFAKRFLATRGPAGNANGSSGGGAAQASGPSRTRWPGGTALAASITRRF